MQKVRVFSLQMSFLFASFRFIVKEGLAILIAWLGEAAAEEQTSVILTIFKVGTRSPFHLLFVYA